MALFWAQIFFQKLVITALQNLKRSLIFEWSQYWHKIYFVCIDIVISFNANIYDCHVVAEDIRISLRGLLKPREVESSYFPLWVRETVARIMIAKNVKLLRNTRGQST